MTVRAGTPLAELEAALAENGPMLAFEPPHFSPAATVGGCVAAGLAGPRRMSAGALKDFVLGAQLLDSEGRILSFGGEVMKNVAGYDVSRLLAGSHGIFGAILEVSLKVVPRPMEELTLVLPATQAQALASFALWRGKPLPISATSWAGDDAQAGGAMTVRLSGAPPAVASARQLIGGEAMAPAAASAWWRSLREQTHPFFAPGQPLWRLALPPTAAALGLGPTLLEWGGGQRWLSGTHDAATLRETAAGWAVMRRCSAPATAGRRPTAYSIRWRRGSLRSRAGSNKSSIRPACSIPAAWSWSYRASCKPSWHPGHAIPIWATRPTPSSGVACIAASAPPPVRPIRCWATNSTVRADAST